MGLIFDTRFIIGVVAGIAALKGYHYWQSRKSAA